MPNPRESRAIGVGGSERLRKAEQPSYVNPTPLGCLPLPSGREHPALRLLSARVRLSSAALVFVLQPRPERSKSSVSTRYVWGKLVGRRQRRRRRHEVGEVLVLLLHHLPRPWHPVRPQRRQGPHLVPVSSKFLLFDWHEERGLAFFYSWNLICLYQYKWCVCLVCWWRANITESEFRYYETVSCLYSIDFSPGLGSVCHHCSFEKSHTCF